MAKVTVGPVIGKVTHSTARVLLEVDANAEVTCSFRNAHGPPVGVTRTLRKGRPGVFAVQGLRPETAYKVTVSGARGEGEGRFTTCGERPGGLTVAAVSCNFTIRRAETDLWADLRDRYVRPDNVNLLLHLGDQIHGDNAFDMALCLLNGSRRPGKAMDQRILELYRHLYRCSWSYAPTREVLASVPNLMIWDDHEIRDDWGSRPCDSDPRSAEHRVGRLARRVFREYQRQLWDDCDIDAQPPDGFENHAHVWGEIGLLFVDQRGGRSFQRDAARPYLGTPQWEWIKAAMQPGGQFSNIRALLVVTSVPLVYLGSTVSQYGSHLMDDLFDHWAYGVHQREQIEMIRLLRNWKEAGRGERELLILGGDVHVGGHTEVRHHGQAILNQLITSPITNKPPSWPQFHGLRLLLETEQRLAGSYTWEHHHFTRQRNYALVVIRVPHRGTPTMNGYLVAPP